MAYCCLFWFVLCFNERLFLFFYFEKLILNLLSFFCNHILSVMPTVDAVDSNSVSVNVLEAQAYAAMQKMEKQRLWRWALRGIVIQ
jgi:hypothetical protein